MRLLERIVSYIVKEREYSPELALEIAQFQVENNPVYRKFCEKMGRLKFRKVEEIPFLPVEFFKYEEIFSCGVPEGEFISSGTTGHKSRVKFSEESLFLYYASALRSFPFRDVVYSLIPPFDFFPESSLAYMLKIFESQMKVEYLNVDFEVSPEKIIPLLMDKKGIIFLTSTQLYRLVKWLETRRLELRGEFIVIDTGGYKNIGKKYSRRELHTYASKFIPGAKFWTEYGMSELFSQFYAPSDGLYREHHYAKVFTDGKGLLRVFDFANLCTVSALLVPDIVVVKGREFDVLGRATEERRGCGYVFR